MRTQEADRKSQLTSNAVVALTFSLCGRCCSCCGATSRDTFKFLFSLCSKNKVVAALEMFSRKSKHSRFRSCMVSDRNTWEG